jgi:predicted nucleic acid-binding protein
MKPRVYIETTIPSFYHENRREPEMVARRHWTREWWHRFSIGFEVVTSQAVLDELEAGDYASKPKVLALTEAIPILPFEPAIIEIVEAYIAHKVMPNDPVGDALHLALASYHKCDFLLTWNCQHLANANKFVHMRRVNVLLGLHVPLLVTPLELMGD